MLIHHPALGPRDSAEFIYIGDAKLCQRPEFFGGEEVADATMQAFYDYTYLRENKAGIMQELWVHKGDHSYLIITRNTITHDILNVEMARDRLNKNEKPKSKRDDK